MCAVLREAGGKIQAGADPKRMGLFYSAAFCVYCGEAQFSDGVRSCDGGVFTGGSFPEGTLYTGISVWLCGIFAAVCCVVPEYGPVWRRDRKRLGDTAGLRTVPSQRISAYGGGAVCFFPAYFIDCILKGNRKGQMVFGGMADGCLRLSGVVFICGDRRQSRGRKLYVGI